MKKKRRFSPIFMTLVLLLLYLPILVVILYSFNANTGKNTTAFTGFSLQWYRQLFDDTKGFGTALGNSLQVAAWSVAVSTVIGTLGAIGMASRALSKWQKRLYGVVEDMATLPIMIPEIVLGMAFMALFYAVGLPFGMLTLVLAHVTFCIPYVFILVKSRLTGLDPSLAEAARDLGASPRRVLFTVTLPLVRPAVLSGAFLALAMSLDDFIISYFVNGASTTTLPVKIYSSVKTGVSLQINALCTLMLAAVFIAVAISQLFANKKIKQQERTEKV